MVETNPPNLTPEEITQIETATIKELRSSNSFQTPAQLLVTMLTDIQNNYLKQDQASIEMNTKIKFAIDKIGHKSIFFVDQSS